MSPTAAGRVRLQVRGRACDINYAMPNNAKTTNAVDHMSSGLPARLSPPRLRRYVFSCVQAAQVGINPGKGSFSAGVSVCAAPASPH